MITTRREFLKTGASGIGLLSMASFAPQFLTQSVAASVPSTEADRSVLVLIQLGGGNDGLNTLIPYGDDQYYKLRPELGIKKSVCLPLNDHFGLHRACSGMERLYKDGSLAIVQNVGYPNPNRSHFRSTEIWETASSSSDYLTSGWLGRYFDNCCAGAPETDPIGLNVGNEMPDSFLSEADHNLYSLVNGASQQNEAQKRMLETALHNEADKEHSNASYLQHTMMNALVTEERVLDRIKAYRTTVAYPRHPLAQDLKRVAALIAAGQQTRVYYVSLSGFDTHFNQADRHARLLEQLSESMAAFQADLVSKKLDDQVLTMTFSEFGRRPAENGSGGTDHGTSAPLFVMGKAVKGGLHGTAPSLSVGPKEDLRFSTDFRSVYSTLIEKWFQADPTKVLESRQTPLGFLA